MIEQSEQAIIPVFEASIPADPRTTSVEDFRRQAEAACDALVLGFTEAKEAVTESR